MTDDLGQDWLHESATRLVAHLRACASMIEPVGDVQNLQHNEFAARAHSLALYLGSVVQLADIDAYPPAFAVVRGSLEHRVFDRLLFLASRYEQLTDPVDDSTWARWQEARPDHVIDWQRERNGRVRIVREGVPVHDPDGSVAYLLSVYYRWWKEYDAFAVPERDYANVAPGHPQERAQTTQHARVQQELWRGAIAWYNLKANLTLNGLVTARELTQLDVHYRFLSAYTHPASKDASDLAYPRKSTAGEPDHYARELLLLYVCTLAIDELRDFGLMSRRPPDVHLRRWDLVSDELTVAEERISHFWAPGRPPYSYDRVMEANQRAFDAMSAEHVAGRPLTRPKITDPATLQESEIRYYANPLRRLIDLHAGFSEMTTGLWWVSPWPRADAQRR